MANGKIRFGKQSGGQLALVIPDGVANTEVIVPESGTLAKTSDINTAGIELKTIATGTATFTNSTNNINLTGIGIGVEIGDVIKITGSTNNNGEFTIEVITDNNNIIVNQAHAGKSRTVAPIGFKALINETATVTVKLLAKSYNAGDGLGQDWVDITASRTNAVYPNNTNRTITVEIEMESTWPGGRILYVNGKGIDTVAINSTVNMRYKIGSKIAKGNNYNVDVFIPTVRWKEYR